MAKHTDVLTENQLRLQIHAVVSEGSSTKNTSERQQELGGKLLLMLPIDAQGELKLTKAQMQNTLQYVQPADGLTLHTGETEGMMINVWRREDA